MRYEKSTVVIIVLATLLVMTFGYILLEKVQVARAVEMQNISQRAYYAGVYDTISSLYGRTENCNVATVNFVNATRQVVDAACIKQEKTQ